MVQHDKRGVLSQSIAMKLEEAIVSGEIASGARLDETTIAERFRVSRTPVREALQIVVSRSLATRIPYRGTVVTQITQDRISELFEAMGEMEALCGRFAAARMRIEERARLEQLHEHMGTLAAAGDPMAYEEANTTFHQMIYDGAQNTEFRDMAEALRLKLAPFRRRQLDNRERTLRSHSEHAQIVEAVLNRNEAAAEKALRRHLTSAAKAMLRHWSGDGATDTDAETRRGAGSGAGMQEAEPDRDHDPG